MVEQRAQSKKLRLKLLKIPLQQPVGQRARRTGPARGSNPLGGAKTPPVLVDFMERYPGALQACINVDGATRITGKDEVRAEPSEEQSLQMLLASV